MDHVRIVFRVHALQRMFRRSVSSHAVCEVIKNGKTIEDRPLETPYPVRLMHLRLEGRHLHVVIAEDVVGSTIYVITVYEPDPGQWDRTFTRRVAR